MDNYEKSARNLRAPSSTTKRGIRFDANVKLHFIPTRWEEYKYFDSLYWNEFDLETFKTEAIEEIERLSSRKNISMKEAAKLLYQPQTAEPRSVLSMSLSKPILLSYFHMSPSHFYYFFNNAGRRKFADLNLSSVRTFKYV